MSRADDVPPDEPAPTAAIARDRKAFVTVTEVAEFVYCEESWRLSRLTSEQTPGMRSGRTLHREWNIAERSTKRTLSAVAVVFIAAVVVALFAAVLR